MSTGLLGSARVLLDGLLALAQTRLELASAELEEELARVLFFAVGAVAVLLLAALGIGFAAAALLIALGEEQRLAAAAAAAGAFLLLALAAGWSLRRSAQARGRPLAASLAELERDRRALLP